MYTYEEMRIFKKTLSLYFFAVAKSIQLSSFEMDNLHTYSSDGDILIAIDMHETNGNAP